MNDLALGSSINMLIVNCSIFFKSFFRVINEESNSFLHTRLETKKLQCSRGCL